MYNMRMLGNSCYWLARENNLSSEQIAKFINSTKEKVEKLFYGRCYPSFNQLEILASIFKLSGVKELLDWHLDHNYRLFYIEPCELSENANSRSMHTILDIMDDVIDLFESLN